MHSNSTRYIAMALLSTVLLTVLTGCASTIDAVIGRQIETVDPNADFDLSEYLFHDKLSATDGEVSFTEVFFRKNERKAVAAKYQYSYRRNGNAIDVQAVGVNGLTHQYVVTENTINDTRPSMGDSRSFKRFARIGDTFLNAEFTKVNVNESCVLANFFDTFHLSSATGTLALSDKSYNNVIRVRCISEFTRRSTNRSNYRWSVYYAKGIGPVFKDGNWQNYLGEIYSVYNY